MMPKVSKKEKTIFIMNKKKVTGDKSGNVIHRKRLTPLAPSTFAASTMDLGMAWRPARKKTTLYPR